MVIFAIFGAALAFIPVEERPLDQWFIAFLRSIYNPTKFHWEKSRSVPEIFGSIKIRPTQKMEFSKDASNSEKRYRAKMFLQSIQSDSIVRDELQEKSASLLAQFQSSNPFTEKTLSPPTTSVPKTILPPTPQPQKVVIPNISGEFRVPSINTVKKQAITPDMQFPSEQLARNEGRVVVIKNRPNPITVAQQPVNEKGQDSSTKGINQEYQTTNALPTQTEKLSTKDVQETVKTNATLPFPKTPTKPNLVVGMVLDKDQRILESAIVEIQNSVGMSVRALKTNVLGQFFTSTPLENGEYILIAEKDGFSFEPQKLVVKNHIIEPLEIRAK